MRSSQYAIDCNGHGQFSQRNPTPDMLPDVSPKRFSGYLCLSPLLSRASAAFLAGDWYGWVQPVVITRGQVPLIIGLLVDAGCGIFLVAATHVRTIACSAVSLGATKAWRRVLARRAATEPRPYLEGSHMEPVDMRSDSRSTFIEATPAQVFVALSDSARVARWWGPDGFRNTIHQFDFQPGGAWLLTMHGPDGKDYANESRFTRIITNELFEIEHLSGHHFVLTIALRSSGRGTQVDWRQTFDTVEHYERIAQFVAGANAQNLQRLAAEVLRSDDAVKRTP